MGTILKLEEEFNSRVNKTGVDYNFKNNLLVHDKQTAKQ